MIIYILEILVFQLAFLLVFDLFLKGETFFQWNRVYLLLTFILSLVLPWVKIEALKTTVSSDLVAYPKAFFQLDAVVVSSAIEEASFWPQWTWYEWVFYFGIAITTLFFLVKLYRIQVLRLKGQKKYYPSFTKVLVTKSTVAFSFFRHVFLGDGIPKEKEVNILAHELVHIKQWHSLDLLFFELMRIVFWFNPLVYVYQSRMSELHEFIADAHVAKTNKKEQYQLLLAEVFQTQRISFVNQFFKSSLIKKRILMLTKKKSKAVYQFKYALLVPLVMGMLMYASCENETNQDIVSSELDFNEVLVQVKDVDNKSSWSQEWDKMFALPGKNCLIIKDNKDFQRHYFIDGKGIYSEDSRFLEKAKARIENVDFPPIFPGCEIGDNLRFCFESGIREHFQKNIQYPDDYKGKASRGSVAVQIVIDKNGKIVDFQRRGTDHHFISEVDRLVALLPKMEPARLGDKAVQMMYIFPVEFNIDEGNTRQENGIVPFAVVDEVPIFPGCENALDKKACFQESMVEHIREHFSYPKIAQESDIQGRVSVVFTIAKDGSITNIRKRGPHQLLEEEAVRIINKLPKMKPGKQEGEVVEVPFSIPITFKLDDGKDINIKMAKAQSLRDILENSKVNEVLSSQISLNKNIEEYIGKHNALVVERNRLLEFTDISNPMIKNLDKELTGLKLIMIEQLNLVQ